MQVLTIGYSNELVVSKGRFGVIIREEENVCRKIFERQCLNSMLREVFILKTLTNVRGITHILEFEPQKCSFTMPYYGVPLNKKMNSSIDSKIKYIRQLYSILASVHHNGITHGDIKLENILVDEQDIITIVDWGSSEINGNPKISRGTNVYTNKSTSHNCDVYSSAIVTIELLISTIMNAPPSYNSIVNYISRISSIHPIISLTLIKMVSIEYQSITMKDICNELHIEYDMSPKIKCDRVLNIDEYGTRYHIKDIQYPLIFLKERTIDSTRALILRSLYTSYPAIGYNCTLLINVYNYISNNCP